MAERLPALRFSALVPPMAVHAALVAHVYRRWGQRGLDVAEAMSTVVYWLAGIEQPTAHRVRRLFLASRKQLPPAAENVTTAYNALPLPRAAPAGARSSLHRPADVSVAAALDKAQQEARNRREEL